MTPRPWNKRRKTLKAKTKAKATSKKAPRSSDGAANGRSHDVERRSIVSRRALPRERLIRFALSPDGCVVPDLGEKLPGRGAWVDASRAAVDEAVQKGLFSRAFKASATAPADLAMQVELALARRCLEILGRARRASALVTGFDKVSAALSGRQAPAVLIEAADGASEGRDKILRAARTAASDIPVLGCFGGEELSLALGRENVIHGALGRGGFAERLKAETLRLSGFRALAPTEWNVAVWAASD